MTFSGVETNAIQFASGNCFPIVCELWGKPQTLLSLYACQSKIDWRSCASSKDEEAASTQKFRQRFADFDFTLSPKGFILHCWLRFRRRERRCKCLNRRHRSSLDFAEHPVSRSAACAAVSARASPLLMLAAWWVTGCHIRTRDCVFLNALSPKYPSIGNLQLQSQIILACFNTNLYMHMNSIN